MNRIKTLAQMKQSVVQFREQNPDVKDIFEFSLSWFEHTPYVWGRDTPEASDCSGTVCRALACAYICSLRVCADELYRSYFTEQVDFDSAICAKFFINRAGIAKHVAGYAGSGLFMNESSAEPCRRGTYRTAAELAARYPDFRIVDRSLNEEVFRT